MAYKPSDVVTVRGQAKSLVDWAAELATPVQTILGRLKRGQSIAEAVSKPVAKNNGSNKGKSFDADVLVGDEVERLLAAGNKSETAVRDRSLIVLAYRSGLRCSEILALAPKDIDIERGTISVHHGKGDKARVVAMDPAAWSQLVQWLDLRATWSPAADARLFCTRDGRPINDRQVRAMFARRAAKAGINKHVHAHGLRRTMASELAAEGVNVLDIGTILGHSNVATTNTYLKRINPTSAINAMKGRAWGQVPTSSARPAGKTVPAPGWLDRLVAEIGDRLMLVHDGRSSESDFRAAVLLF